jgi:hypothetical protein
MKDRIYSPINLLTAILALAAFVIPSTAFADGPRTGTSVDFFGTVRAGACDPGNPSVGIIDGTTPDSALVYGAPFDRPCVAVTAPDGHQLTLGEFKSVEGLARINCVNRGTLVSMHLTGLVPRGVYSAWIPVTAGNIFPPAIAATAMGSVLGDTTFVNTFNASASGEGQLTLIQPAGTGTLMPGPIPLCLLDTAHFEIHVAYHMDGQTHGGVPGPPPTWVVQERFLFPHQ